jgi:hypothetical protein
MWQGLQTKDFESLQACCTDARFACSFRDLPTCAIMDPELADDAKLMALTICLAVGVWQMARWIVFAVRSFRHGVVYDVEHYTAHQIAGKKQIIQLRRRQKLQPIMITS